jgi:hypothetical protein
MSFVDQAIAFFTGRGWSPEQAAGIAGNLHYESGGGNIAAIGDGGKAFGLAQWHPDRQKTFQSLFGKPIQQASQDEQFAFVDWELNNTEKGAGKALRAATSIADAAKTFMSKFERPANMSSLADRIAAASGNGSGGFLDSVSGFMNYDLGKPLGEALDSVNPFASLLNGETAARITAVVIGVILVGLAIAAFLFMSDAGKQALAIAKPL